MIIDGIFINYIQYGNKDGHNMVLLHGWGQNIEMMKPIGNAFKSLFNITIIDLPGFGSSDEPKETWRVISYAKVLKKLLDKLKIKNPILIGHSFGGRVAIVYASMYQVQKLVLFASPFEKTTNGVSIKVRVLKTMKKFIKSSKIEKFIKNKVGSSDYKNASEMMKKVLVETINTNLTENAKKILCPTLLVWGEADTAVDVEEARKLEKLISGSGLVVFPYYGHYAYLENLSQTVTVLDKFLEKESRGYNEN